VGKKSNAIRLYRDGRERHLSRGKPSEIIFTLRRGLVESRLAEKAAKRSRYWKNKDKKPADAQG
jgi:hypothetical protein